MTNFRIETDIYWQEEGLVTGLPLSPVLVNWYIEYFEEMALGCTSIESSLELRYIDDTFIFWPYQEYVQILLDHINSIWSSIQFTVEKEQDNRLSFLNVLITCTEQGFMPSMYQNPTFTRQYLNFNSYHPYDVKKGIICCLQKPIVTVMCIKRKLRV